MGIFLAAVSGAGAFRVVLDEGAFDARNPAPGDFLDCPGPQAPCQSVVLPRVMAEEKLETPAGMSLEKARFLSLKGIRADGGDPIFSLGLFGTGGGDSIFADWNGDEKLGNDGPARFWPRGDSCILLEKPGAMPPLVLCRAGARAQAWKAKCEEMKGRVTWAICEEPAFKARLLDIRAGWMQSGGKSWWIGLNDVDGDGRYLPERGDRLVVDWDGNGVLDKSPEAEGVAPKPGFPLRFSLDSASFEVSGADESGGWVDLKRLPAYDPAAAGPGAVEGRPAPDLRFVNMDGDTVRLSDLRGKKVLLHFWSTLCKPCLENLEAVRSFRDSFAKRNWEVVSLTVETDLAAVQQAVLQRKMDWTVGMAGPEARRYYANRPLPVLVKVDERGVVENRNLVLGGRAF